MNPFAHLTAGDFLAIGTLGGLLVSRFLSRKGSGKPFASISISVQRKTVVPRKVQAERVATTLATIQHNQPPSILVLHDGVKNGVPEWLPTYYADPDNTNWN